MQKNNFKSLIHLHFLIFLWGFTSIFGALIDLNPIFIVWLRLAIASILIFIYLFFDVNSLKLSKSSFFKFFT